MSVQTDILAFHEVSVEKRLKDLQKILEVAKDLATETDFDKLLVTITKNAMDILECDRATVFMYDEKSNELFVRIGEGLVTREFRMPSNTGIAGHVAMTGEILNIADAYKDSRFNQEVDKKTGYKTNTILCVPLRSNEGRKIGALQVLNKFDGTFHDYDEYLLTALGSQAAVAIDNEWKVAELVDKERMKHSLTIAHDIQMSFMPHQSPEVKGLTLAGHSDPCDETGGDYFDFVPMGDGKVGLIVGDVTGHGVGSALIMASARASLRSIMRLSQATLEDALAILNNLLEEDTDDEKFMTLFFGILDSHSGTLEYSSAGHDEPILLRAADDSIEMLESTGLPLGMMDDQDFPSAKIQLEDGDLLAIMTDGIWEAMNTKQDTYGIDRVTSMLKKNKALPVEKIMRAVYDDVASFCGDEPRRDDMTMILARKSS